MPLCRQHFSCSSSHAAPFSPALFYRHALLPGATPIAIYFSAITPIDFVFAF